MSTRPIMWKLHAGEFEAATSPSAPQATAVLVVVLACRRAADGSYHFTGFDEE